MIGGGTPSKSNPSFYTGDILWATVGDMRSDYIEDTALKITDAAVRESSTHIIPKGNVVIATRVGLGKVCLTKFDTAINQDLRGVIPKKKHELFTEFLFWWFKSISNEIVKHGSGATVHGVKQTFINSLDIPLPPLPEQKRIVKILDEVFENIEKAKENTEKNLRNAKELFEMSLAQRFENPGDEWEFCALNDHVRFIDYRGRTPKKTKSGIRLVTAKNIKKGYLQREPEEFIAESSYKAWMTRGIPLEGDVLFTTEAPLANVAQLDTGEKVAFAQRVIIFQPDRNRLNPTFLKYLLLSPQIQKRILEKGTGATVKGIKASLLKKIEIYFPLFSEQKKIVSQLDSLSAETKKLEELYQKKLADLEELKKSVLRKAFSGKLSDYA